MQYAYSALKCKMNINPGANEQYIMMKSFDCIRLHKKSSVKTMKALELDSRIASTISPEVFQLI